MRTEPGKDDGYSVALWDLVCHDCVVNTTPWHRPHNKYPYGWDHQDRAALRRGQTPLLNMSYDGVQGLASRKPNTLADSAGTLQSTTISRDHYIQTHNSVCKWHGQIGAMEMIDHARLSAGRGVQMSKFSNDGGASGRPLRLLLAAGLMEAVIPSKCNRKIPIPHHRFLYRTRNRLERCFNKLKHFRPLRPPGDRQDAYFRAFLHPACALLWLR
jgi:transposase